MKFFLLSLLALSTVLISGCSSGLSQQNNQNNKADFVISDFVINPPKKQLDLHINKIEAMIADQSRETSTNSLNAIKAFNYHPKVFETCIKNEVDYYYSNKDPHRNVTVEDCLFASRIETLANLSILNTNYAADVLRQAEEASKFVNPVYISEGFYINKKATISKVIESVAKMIGFRFNLINRNLSDYSIYQFESKPHETPIGFLTRVDEDHPNLSIKIKVEEKNLNLSFLVKESLVKDNKKNKSENAKHY